MPREVRDNQQERRKRWLKSSKARQSADLDRLYETVAKVTGQVDVVFGNAGVGEFASFGPSLRSISTHYSTSM
jgi:hypothetical protein